MSNAKEKMNRGVAKKFTGFLKGFYNKARTKVKSSVYRKGGNLNQSINKAIDDGKINLTFDHDDGLKDSASRYVSILRLDHIWVTSKMNN